MKKAILITILSFFIIALAACASKTEDLAEAAITVPIYTAIAIPAAITYPFVKASVNAHKKEHLPKSREYIVGKHGKPIAKYNCQGIEVWEYRKNNTQITK